MSHNLTQDDKGIFYRKLDENGNPISVKIAGARIFSRCPQWHKLGYQDATRNMDAIQAASFVDPDAEFESQLAQLAIVQYVPGSRGQKFVIRPVPYAMIQRNAETDETGVATDGLITYGDPVYTGATSWDELFARNGSEVFTRSAGYELITFRRMAEIIYEEVRDMDGNPVTIESVGILGKNGKDGYFYSTPLPKWDAAVANRIGSNVDEYMHFVGTYGNSMFTTYNTSIVAVCQNTLIFGQAAASMMLKLDHKEGAEDRLRGAIRTVYGTALANRGLSQDIAVAMAESPFTADEVREVAEKVYRLPGEPDATFIAAKSTMAERMESYRMRLQTALAQREAVVEVFSNPNWHGFAGITKNVEGTAFGAWQAFTAATTYAPMGADRSFRSNFLGEGRNIITGSFNQIMQMIGKDDMIKV